MPVGDLMRIGYWCMCGDQVGLNVRHYEITALSAPPPIVQEIADSISTSAALLYLPILGADAQYWGVSIDFPLIVPRPTTVYSSVGRNFGTSGANVLPTQVTGIATFRSALAGRANRGRIYYPFPPVSSLAAVTPPRPNVGYQGGLTATLPLFTGVSTYASLVTPAETISFKSVIPHPGGNIEITSATVRAMYATQRSRGNYGRGNVPPF